MKRNLLIIGILLPLSYAGHAQVLISILLGDKLNSDKLEFGLVGGLNLSDIHGADQASSVARFNLGFYFDITLKQPSVFFHTGVLVKSTMGAKGLPVYDLGDNNLNSAFDGGQVDRRLSYFNVPLLVKYKFRNNFYLEGGAMAGLRTKAEDIFMKKIIDDDDLTYELSVKDDIRPLDAGLLVGLGYRLMRGHGMNLGARYYVGLVDVVIDDSTPDQYNRSIYFSLGIPIGKGKAEE